METTSYGPRSLVTTCAASTQTYDVTDAFRQGDNVLGVILGNGWYNLFTDDAWGFRFASWRSRPKLLLQVRLELTDGSEGLIVSDATWSCASGPILFDGLRHGEIYDARCERPGWDQPGYTETEGWKPASLVPGAGGALRSQQMTPIRPRKPIRPVSVKEPRSGVFVFDLGRNFSGWCRLRLDAPAGTEIVLRHGERTEARGELDAKHIRVFVRDGEFQTDRYICGGGAPEAWSPRFTYHGFQYVEMTGFPGVPTLDTLTGIPVYTDFADKGGFDCSHPLLNRIHTLVRWSTLSNYHGIPTDCPHREKNGWTGDASLSAEQPLLNFDPATAYHKWMADFRDAQRPSGQLPGIIPTGGWGYNWGSGPAWDSAGILIPWYVYLYCGDTALLAEHYLSMKRYVEFVTTMANNGIVELGLGDWCPPTSAESGPNSHECPTAVTDTSYYYVDALLLSRIAKLLGKIKDAAAYSRLAKRIRHTFRRAFVDLREADVAGSCQTSVACALYQGLIDEEETPAFVATLVRYVEEKNRHIDTGILGAKYLLHTLTDHGRADLAYAVATQTDFPSWGYWIAQGATTLWENWAGEASRLHHMFSDVGAWLYKGLAGINPDPEQPGFRNTIFRPHPLGDLTSVAAWHESPYGRVGSSWRRDGRDLRLEVQIPPNATGTVVLPTGATSVGIDGRTGGSCVLGSGAHVITCRLQHDRGV